MNHSENFGEAKFLFREVSSDYAWLRVEQSNGTFGFSTLNRYTRALGHTDASLYEITLPDTPVDGRLKITRRTTGMKVEFNALGDQTPSLFNFVKGSTAEGHEGFVGSLPAGDYWIVRSQRTLVHKNKIFMGNEQVASPSDVLVVTEGTPFYSYVFGTKEDAPPGLGGPLIGVPVLNYFGDSEEQGVIFFSFTDARPQIEGSAILYVVPSSGEMVLNTNVGFRSNELQEDSRRWHESQAEQFIQRLMETGD